MTSDPVESYFRSIDIRRAKSQAVFEKLGRKRFGKTFEQLLFIVAQRESGVEIDPYEVKNSSLDLSLYVGEYHASGMWRGFASWLARIFQPRLQTFEKIAACCHVSKRTVATATYDLERRKWVKIVRDEGGDRESNRYFFAFDRIRVHIWCRVS